MLKKLGSSREWLLIVYVVIILLTAIAGLRFVTVYFNESRKTVVPEVYDKYYVVIPDSNQSSFWDSVCEGANTYGLANNVYVENLASSFPENLSKEELMRIAIASNVDGIMVSADETEVMSELIDEASSKGIPVVTLYNDSGSSNRICYVGVGNYNIGTEYGRLAINLSSELIEAKAYNDDIDVVVLVSQTPTQAQMMIYSTIQETFDKSDIAYVLNLSMVKIDNSTTFSVEESIRDIFIGEDLPEVIICLSESETTCVYQAVIDYNKVGLVNILGYYASENILQGIMKNTIDSTIRIDAVQMGEYGVEALIEYDQAGFTSQYSAVDIAVINSTNVYSYLGGHENEE